MTSKYRSEKNSGDQKNNQNSMVVYNPINCFSSWASCSYFVYSLYSLERKRINFFLQKLVRLLTKVYFSNYFIVWNRCISFNFSETIWKHFFVEIGCESLIKVRSIKFQPSFLPPGTAFYKVSWNIGLDSRRSSKSYFCTDKDFYW